MSLNMETHPGVGSTQLDTTQQNAKGYQAQGFALAQTVIATSIGVARQLQRSVITAFDYSTEARTACAEALGQWVKDCKAAAKNSGNLEKMGAKALSQVGTSATVRASEFRTVMGAMNAGMTKDTVAEACGVADPENISFHVYVAQARLFMQTSATRAGRPADPFPIKLDKWLSSQRGDEDQVTIVRIRELLADILPHMDPDSSAETTVRIGKAPAVKKAAVKSVPIPESASSATGVEHLPAVPARRRRAADQPTQH